MAQDLDGGYTLFSATEEGRVKYGPKQTYLADVVFVVKHEGGDVGRDDGRVEDEDQDQPVPDGFERRIVEDGKVMNVE